jgi:hypothetical protein
MDPRGNIILRDANNYTSTAMLDIPTIETAAGVDLDICWTEVVSDLQCHPVAPAADLDNVGLIRIVHFDETEIEEQLTSGELPMSAVAAYLEHQTNHTDTCTKLSQLSFLGTAIDVVSEYTENPDYTYLMVFTKGTRPGVGARSMVFLRPTAASTNRQVNAPPGCGRLDFTANLTAATPVDVPEAGPWVVDWRELTKDGQGNPVVTGRIDGLILGYYQGKTVADLQSQIFDIELIATTLWDLRLTAGTTADLAKAKARGTGAAFPGFAGAAPGVWMVGLTCSGCSNPAPVALAILNPGPGGP